MTPFEIFILAITPLIIIGVIFTYVRMRILVNKNFNMELSELQKIIKPYVSVLQILCITLGIVSVIAISFSFKY